MSNPRTPVAHLNDLADGEVRVVEVGRHSLLLVRTGETITACARLCPHEKADLALGHVTDGRLMCPRHRASFSLTTGTVSPGWRVDPLGLYPVTIEDDTVMINTAALEQSGQPDLWDLTTPSPAP